MLPESFAAAEIVTFTGFAPSVSRTTALVVHPEGPVFVCTCTRVTVTALSGVHVEPVHVVVSAPGRKMFCSPRGNAVNASFPTLSLYVETPPELTSEAPAWFCVGVLLLQVAL